MMTRQSFMRVAAAVSVVSGVLALGAPVPMSSLFGITLDGIAVSQVRLLGAAYLGYAAISWFARDVTDRAAARAIALGSVVSWGISAVVTVTIIDTGLADVRAWLLVAVEVIFAATWTFYAFADRTALAHA